MRLICSIFFFLAASLSAVAIKAPSRPITVIQADGSAVELIMHGDEFFRYATTLDGRVVAMGPDGFLYPASYSPDVLRLTMSRLSVNSRSGWSGGPVRILVIPVAFADIDFSCSDPKDHIDRLLNSPGYSDYGGSGSVKDYFEANIPGLDLNFDVCSPVKLSREAAYYGGNDHTTPSVIRYDSRLQDLVTEACRSADAEVDFSSYDGDGDGYVDFLFLFYAGYNEAESGLEDLIWPQNHSMGNTGSRFDGVLLGDFACSSELMGSDLSFEGQPGTFAGIGTICHEIGHYFGLVDLYDTDYNSGGRSDCLWGRLSVMDEGNYNNNGRTPPYFCAIDRELAGIANYMRYRADTTFTLPPAIDSSQIVRISTTNPGEYYLLENRVAESWDAYIGGSGMLIYHIDKSANNVEGITASVRWSTNLVNACASHECADLIVAYPKAEHISQVFFPGQAMIDRFEASGDPAFIAWDGSPLGIRLHKIRQEERMIHFDIQRDSSEVLLSPVNLRIESYQRQAIAEWENGRNGIYLWGLTWGPTDSSVVYRDSTILTRYSFSDLEPRSSYFCQLYHIGRTGYGDTLSLRFHTGSITSPYPYIHLPAEGSFSVGDTLRLVIENLSEDISSCQWYINGHRILTGRYIFPAAGSYDVEARIEYNTDGSREIIRRKLQIDEEGGY